MTDVRVWTFAGYEIRDILDVDLVSTTYRAVTASRNGPVALRIIAEEVLEGEAFDVAESVRETLWQAARIDHPNLLPILDVGLLERSLYAVTEYVPGMSLAELIAREGSLEEDVALSIAGQIGGALDTIHQYGIVHGAINPHTIWVAHSDRELAAPRAYLTGFGTSHLLAQRVRARGKSPAPDDVLYVDPEQLRQQPLTGRADQYALACALFQCLTGKPPFVRETVNSLFGAHLFAKHSSLSEEREGVVPEIDAALHRALAKDPDERYPSCAAFITAAGGRVVVRRQRGPAEPGEPGRPAAVRPQAPRADTNGPAAPAAEGDTKRGDAAPVAEGDTSRLDAPATDRDTERTDAPRPAEAERVRPRKPRPAQPEPATPPPARRRPVGPQLRFVPEYAKLRSGRQLWLIPAVLVLLVAVVGLAALLLGRDDGEVASPADEAPAEPEAQPQQEAERAQGRPPRVVGPRWSQAVGSGPVQVIERGENLVAAGVGNELVALNMVTGEERWRARASGEVLEVAIIGDVLVARTPAALHGFDANNGEQRWSLENRSAVIESIAAGRTLLYGATSEENGIDVLAFDPASGRFLWEVGPLEASPSGDLEMTYDKSERDGEMLYVLQNSSLYGINTGNASLRWRIDVEGPWIRSLQAIAAATFVTSNDGSVCRHAAADGHEVWTFCQELLSVAEAEPHVHVRNARVIVATAGDVTAFDFTNGLARWRLTAADELQRAVAGNQQAVYIAKIDGTVRALDHESGIERWRAEEFGEVTAMLSDVDGVYVGSADGSVARFQETATTTRSGL